MAIITTFRLSPTSKLKAREWFWETWNLGSPSLLHSVRQLLQRDMGRGLGEQDPCLLEHGCLEKEVNLKRKLPLDVEVGTNRSTALDTPKMSRDGARHIDEHLKAQEHVTAYI